jgi:hypothetical protein
MSQEIQFGNKINVVPLLRARANRAGRARKSVLRRRKRRHNERRTVEMKITLEETETIATIGGSVPARIWKGHTENGVPVKAWVALIQPQTHDAEAHKQFEQEMTTVPATRQLTSFDVRLL